MMASRIGRAVGVVAALTGSVPAALAQERPPPLPAGRESPWNATWRLDPVRNPQQIKDAAAEDYRFHLFPDGRIRWEIPSLHEIAEGRTDGVPFPIHRPGSAGMSLAVRSEGRQVLTYQVFQNGTLAGGGRMTLAEQDRTWVDISWPAGRPDLAGIVIYAISS